MTRWLKWIGLTLGGVLVLALSVIWLGSELLLRETYTPMLREVRIPTSPTDLAEGERLARVLGCMGGCHGRDMEGGDLFDFFDGSQLRSPNLTRIAQDYSPAQFEAAVRQGIKPDGRSVLAMPSANFATMTDEHLGQILAFIEAYPAQDDQPPQHRIMPIARLFLLLGEFQPAVAESVPGRNPVNQADLADPAKLGEYLALNACTECHGLDLAGIGGFTPSLVTARAYSEEEFTKLMNEGIALGGRDVGLMTEMGQRRFTHLKPFEIRALYGWLQQASLPLTDVTHH